MANHILQLKIALADIKPQIWRRILIQDDCSLNFLHYVIQDAFDWQNSHLHQFRDQTGTCYMDPLHDPDDGEEDENEISIGDLLANQNDEITYTYDFGDNWTHVILLEERLTPEKRKKYPLCSDGECATPPDDCGGSWGFKDFLEIMSDPKHEEHKSMIEWFGGKFDPEAFDLKRINKNIKDRRCLKLTQEAMRQFGFQ